MSQEDDNGSPFSGPAELPEAELVRRREALRKMAKFAITAGGVGIATVLTSRRALANSCTYEGVHCGE